MSETSTAPEIFAALQERSPQMEIDGIVYWLVEGDLMLDRSQLWSYALRRVEAQQDRSTAEVQPLVLTTDTQGRIVRWRKGKTLTYCVRRSTFGSQEQYQLVVDTMHAACADWEAVCGVNFQHLSELDVDTGETTESPLFDVIGVSEGVKFIAVAFFPDWAVERRHVYIFPPFFDENLFYDRTGIMRHELGHVLGFRHEHIRPGVSPDCPKDEVLGDHFPFGDYDPKSVMHYFCGGVGTREMRLTDVDRAGARYVYGPPDREMTYMD